MIQTIIVLLILVAGAALVQYNQPALQSQLTLTAPGAASVTVPLLTILEWIGGAFILVWLAGLIDREILWQRIRRHSAALRAMEAELAGVKAATYDRQQPMLTDIRARLEEVDRDLRALGKQVEEEKFIISSRIPVEQRRG